MYEVPAIETGTALSESTLLFINTGSDVPKVRKGLSLVGETELSPLAEKIVPEFPPLSKITEYPAPFVVP